MLRFKLFSGDAASLEADVNGWLEAFEPDVTQMVQTVDNGGRLVMAFLFEESFRGQERRFDLEKQSGSPAARATIPGNPADDTIVVPIEPGSSL